MKTDTRLLLPISLYCSVPPTPLRSFSTSAQRPRNLYISSYSAPLCFSTPRLLKRAICLSLAFSNLAIPKTMSTPPIVHFYEGNGKDAQGRGLKYFTTVFSDGDLESCHEYVSHLPQPQLHAFLRMNVLTRDLSIATSRLSFPSLNALLSIHLHLSSTVLRSTPSNLALSYAVSSAMPWSECANSTASNCGLGSW